LWLYQAAGEDSDMRGYGRFIIGCAAGLAAAFLLNWLVVIEGTLQLLIFGLLPAFGGAILERYAR
jgi:hypothetical protein